MQLHRCTKLHASITLKHCEAMRSRSGWTASGTLSRPPQCADCTEWMQWDDSNTVNLKPTKEEQMPKQQIVITQDARAQYDAALERIKDVTGCKTQVQLAEYLDIRQSSISDSKRRASIPPEWLIRIWRKTTVSPDWIIYGDEAGQRYAVPSDVTGQAVNAVVLRERIKNEIRAELDNLHLEDLIDRIRAMQPDVQITYPAQVGGGK
ncbi:helix-turn-helix domain-containing protein [Pseudodesulfovibrio sp.]|uniref:helix-turn-helix domain-containing protein n=1 Tax=Pseudodesulfovibrio sp. TaxID=2035812 RepID=UPI00260692F2|nr:helix-turn-helix domain-containing protein [Pseudodesulfovibrio sp.]MDD3310989.1 helix-turn-helix domain-containing protein [Pseudodesulfovibrio sp.]